MKILNKEMSVSFGKSNKATIKSSNGIVEIDLDVDGKALLLDQFKQLVEGLNELSKEIDNFFTDEKEIKQGATPNDLTEALFNSTLGVGENGIPRPRIRVTNPIENMDIIVDNVSTNNLIPNDAFQYWCDDRGMTPDQAKISLFREPIRRCGRSRDEISRGTHCRSCVGCRGMPGEVAWRLSGNSRQRNTEKAKQIFRHYFPSFNEATVERDIADWKFLFYHD